MIDSVVSTLLLKLNNSQFIQEVRTRLSKHLASRQHLFRPKQVEAFKALDQTLSNGKVTGLFKHPPGAGKTRLFAEIISAVSGVSLILLPTTPLFSSTESALKDAGLAANQIFSIRPRLDLSAAKGMEQAFNECKDQSLQDKPRAIICTYSALLRTYTQNRELFKDLMQATSVIISDEAHTSLGYKTKSALMHAENIALHQFYADCVDYMASNFQEIEKAVKNDPRTVCRNLVLEVYKQKYDDIDVLVRDGKILEYSDILFQLIENSPRQKKGESIYEHIQVLLDKELQSLFEGIISETISSQTGKGNQLHLRFTATPQTLMKRVEKTFGIPVIHSTTIAESVQEGSTILPTHVSYGKATYKSKEPIDLTDQVLKELFTKSRFQMEDSSPIEKAAIDRWLELKEQSNGYLPSVFVCATIEQAAFATAYMQSRGIRAERVTSGNATFPEGMNSDLAKELLEKMPDDPERLEIAVTVGKIGMGWDCRTVRCIGWLCHVRSPARSIQGNGRGMRTLLPQDPWPKKSSENTFILEPSWEIVEPVIDFKELSNLSPEEQAYETVVDFIDPLPTSDKEKTTVLCNSIEMMLMMGELDLETALRSGAKLTRIKFNPNNPEHLRVLIGKPETLLKGNIPSNLSLIDFEQAALGWKVEGEVIRKKFFGKTESGVVATLDLINQLWPGYDLSSAFDYRNPNHLRELFGSPSVLFDEERNFSFKKLDSPTVILTTSDGKWSMSGSRLLGLLFPGRIPFPADIENLHYRLWSSSLRRKDVTDQQVPVDIIEEAPITIIEEQVPSSIALRAGPAPIKEPQKVQEIPYDPRKDYVTLLKQEAEKSKRTQENITISYDELKTEQNGIFTMVCLVKGHSFHGTATNKKDAKKKAAYRAYHFIKTGLDAPELGQKIVLRQTESSIQQIPDDNFIQILADFFKSLDVAFANKPVYSERWNTPHNTFRFTCTVGKKSVVGLAGNAREAKRISAYQMWSWISLHITEDGFLDVESLQELKLKVPDSFDGPKYLSKLQNLYQKGRIKKPEYAFIQLDTEVFQCTCSAGEIMTVGVGNSKQEARYLAAYFMNSKLDKVVPDQEAHALASPQSYTAKMQALQNWSTRHFYDQQKWELVPPEDSVSNTSLIARRLRIGPFYFDGYGSTNTEAQLDAADGLLSEISRIVFSDIPENSTIYDVPPEAKFSLGSLNLIVNGVKSYQISYENFNGAVCARIKMEDSEFIAYGKSKSIATKWACKLAIQHMNVDYLSEDSIDYQFWWRQLKKILKSEYAIELDEVSETIERDKDNSVKIGFRGKDYIHTNISLGVAKQLAAKEILDIIFLELQSKYGSNLTFDKHSEDYPLILDSRIRLDPAIRDQTLVYSFKSENIWIILNMSLGDYHTTVRCLSFKQAKSNAIKNILDQLPSFEMPDTNIAFDRLKQEYSSLKELPNSKPWNLLCQYCNLQGLPQPQFRRIQHVDRKEVEETLVVSKKDGTVLATLTFFTPEANKITKEHLALHALLQIEAFFKVYQ